jgi:hypothetical protein
MVLNKEWGPAIRLFLRKTGVGFWEKLRWEDRYNEHDFEMGIDDDEDEFEVGEFK